MTRIGDSRPTAPKPKRGKDTAAQSAAPPAAHSTAKQNAPAPSAQSTPPSVQHRATGLASAPVDQAVIALIKRIALHDPQRRQKAFRCFLEYSMRKELALTQMNSAAFDSLVENTIGQMQADADLQRDMAQAMDALIALADRATGQAAIR